MQRLPPIPLTAIVATCAVLATAERGVSQVPLGIRTASGLSVTPVYEGWYENPDGTFSLSFGYYNRNFEEIVDLPHGAANRMEPAAFDGAQPTRFHPRRHWGVFTVTVPADFGNQAVVWTIDFRGERYSIPGRLHLDWRIDALDGEAETGNTPPVLAFAEDGPRGAGPGGPWGKPVEGVVDKPVPLTVWAWDDGRSRGSVVRAGRAGVPVTLTWFTHQGTGDVTFEENAAKVPIEGGRATTMANFTEPGDYVLRVRANDASGVSTAGHAQCCWTNGFVRVTVTR